MCDLAETYGIYDYKRLPVKYLATLAVGLRENSRTKMKINGSRMPIETILMAGILDHLKLLVWAQSEDGQKNQNRPESVLEILNGDMSIAKSGYETAEEFEKARSEFFKR